ncbi:unnamed protein product [Adineta steineri]|uniref:Cadherin domain-containing protein n=1 Tax=Adineta steineri TaxID=433720 RepID=A0A819E714_9BILA|nr:unnamed protein product [Adineta steineri]
MTIIYIFFLLISSVSSILLDIRYPQFFHQSLHDSAIEISEGKVSGSFIAFINLINDTNIILNEWILNTTNSDFKIQSNGISYVLINTQILDRERVDFYDFSIIAQHLIPSFEQISKNIRIRILDINDCAPTFNQTSYQVTFISNETSFTVTAFDCDEPNTENSRISYSLSNYQDLFRINESTGRIESIKTLQTYERYDIIVVARDHGKPSSLSSTTLVQIQLASTKSESRNSSLWFQYEQNSRNMFLLAGILASCFVFLCLLICLICCINYKIKRRKQENFKEKKFSSTATINSTNDFQQTSVYDAINIFPNTYYLPVEQSTEFIENRNNSNNNEISLQIPQSSSTTSSPISANDVGTKIGSDDGCYCSSDMSSEQSNNILLLNPSSLTLSSFKLSSKHVRFNENNNIDGVLKRFENLYGSQANTDHCASYV